MLKCQKRPLPTPEQRAELMRHLDEEDKIAEQEECEQEQIMAIVEEAIRQVPVAQMLHRLAIPDTDPS